jgi:predicted RNA-binding Zn-ribbon protein involved in translation (DUF1610 family)
MGSAHFCPVCGDIIGGWDQDADDDCFCITGIDSNGNVPDPEKTADYIVEQFDFGTDALVEALNYLEAATVATRSLPIHRLASFDKARVSLSLGRAIEEAERFVESYCGSPGEQVRCEAHDC